MRRGGLQVRKRSRTGVRKSSSGNAMDDLIFCTKKATHYVAFCCNFILHQLYLRQLNHYQFRLLLQFLPQRFVLLRQFLQFLLQLRVVVSLFLGGRAFF